MPNSLNNLNQRICPNTIFSNTIPFSGLSGSESCCDTKNSLEQKNVLVKDPSCSSELYKDNTYPFYPSNLQNGYPVPSVTVPLSHQVAFFHSSPVNYHSYYYYPSIPKIPSFTTTIVNPMINQTHSIKRDYSCFQRMSQPTYFGGNRTLYSPPVSCSIYQSIQSTEENLSSKRLNSIQPASTVPSYPSTYPVLSYPSSTFIYPSPVPVVSTPYPAKLLSVGNRLICPTTPVMHIVCYSCNKRINLPQNNIPNQVVCSSCSALNQINRRFIHGYKEPCFPSNDLELPCLFGKTEYQDRMNTIQQYISTVMSCDCSESLLFVSVERVLTAAIQKVDRTVTKQKKSLYEECKHVLNQLYSRVELYCQGNLHCCCFSPYLPQRHFIQCNSCSLWFHTSCVNVDSRRISNIVTFVCSWCQKKGEMDDKDSSSPSDESIHSSTSNQRAQRVRGEDVMSIFDLSMSTGYIAAEGAQPECVCPVCKRSFDRPCNLSRHLHAKHSMKWSTHVVMNTDVDAYLVNQHENPGNEPISISVSQERFLLRKIRSKPNEWWIGKQVRVWHEEQQLFVCGKIIALYRKKIFRIQLENGEEEEIVDLFSSRKPIQLIALHNTLILDLFKAVPYSIQRDVFRDVKLFL